MKVQLNVKMSSKGEGDVTLRIPVSAADTPSSIMERVAAMQPIPFPEQDLMLNGKVIGQGMKLVDCDVKDGCSLDLVVKASEDCLVQQLKGLLEARDLSCDELGLLYCYKYGASIAEALKILGVEEKLQEFIKRHKTFAIESGRVALVRQDTSLKPFSAAEEVEAILKATSSGRMEVKELNAKFLEKFNIDLARIIGMKVNDFLAQENDRFKLVGRNVVCLKSEADDAPAQKSEKAPMPQWDASAIDVQRYQELHEKISNRAFNSKVAQALNGIVDAVMESSFLNIDHIVKGGSVGNGTATASSTDAEVVCFVRGLPTVGQDRYLPPLVRSMAGALSDRVLDSDLAESIYVTDDAVVVRAKDGVITVNIRFSPMFESSSAIIQAMGEQDPDSHDFYSTSLVKHRVQLVARQPGQVKVTIRLLKWWRAQQDWSSQLYTPSNEILETLVVYSACQTKPVDIRMAIANVMSMLAKFDELRIVWSNLYNKDDVWEPLLHQRPLLMDPVNPFVNIADPECFDSEEVMRFAQTTQFFW